MPVTFLVGGDEITVQAQPGQNIWEVGTVEGSDNCTLAQQR